MKTAQEIKQFIIELEKDYDFNQNPSEFLDNDGDFTEIETTQEEVREFLEKINEEREITDCEVIYYASAIEYLKENDPSLSKSISIASEYGFPLEKINSELLASLLESRNNEEDYQEFINKVCEFIDKTENN